MTRKGYTRTAKRAVDATTGQRPVFDATEIVASRETQRLLALARSAIAGKRVRRPRR